VISSLVKTHGEEGVEHTPQRLEAKLRERVEEERKAQSARFRWLRDPELF